jgi:antitoxin component YwqK of YwqJK toxin-antitoxin module
MSNNMHLTKILDEHNEYIRDKSYVYDLCFNIDVTNSSIESKKTLQKEWLVIMKKLDDTKTNQNDSESKSWSRFFANKLEVIKIININNYLNVDGKNDLNVDGKNDLNVDNKNDLNVDGKNDLNVDNKNDLNVDGKNDLSLNDNIMSILNKSYDCVNPYPQLRHMKYEVGKIVEYKYISSDYTCTCKSEVTLAGRSDENASITDQTVRSNIFQDDCNCYGECSIQRDERGVGYFTSINAAYYFRSVPNNYTGEWITSYQNGNKEHKGSYDKGLKKGLWKSWNEDGRKLSLGEYSIIEENNNKRSVKNGFWSSWNYNGTVSSMGKYVHGRREGFWIETFDDGQTSEEGYYVHDKKMGTWSEWFPNGQKSSFGSYINDEQDGVWTLWHQNGVKGSEGMYVNGKKSGKWIDWHSNGQVALEYEFTHGIKTGKWIHWYRNKQIESVGSYVDGKRNGKWIEWHYNGEKYSEGEYLNGTKVGHWKKWPFATGTEQNDISDNDNNNYVDNNIDFADKKIMSDQSMKQRIIDVSYNLIKSISNTNLTEEIDYSSTSNDDAFNDNVFNDNIFDNNIDTVTDADHDFEEIGDILCIIL